MAKTICPGQDTSFWGPDDIFEVECGGCGQSVEFFKDDTSRLCPHCGVRIVNPKLSLGCAQWCEHAAECLGYDPKTVELTEEQEASLADTLVEELKQQFGDDTKRISHALLVYGFARRILRDEPADPRVVVAAALLHDIGIQEAERVHGSSGGKYQEIEGPPIARRIMEAHDVDHETIEHVCRIVGSHHSADDLDTPEFRIIWDADWLVNLGEEPPATPPEELRGFIERTFRTGTGRAIASRRFLHGNAEVGGETEREGDTDG